MFNLFNFGLHLLLVLFLALLPSNSLLVNRSTIEFSSCERAFDEDWRLTCLCRPEFTRSDCPDAGFSSAFEVSLKPWLFSSTVSSVSLLASKPTLWPPMKKSWSEKPIELTRLASSSCFIFSLAINSSEKKYFKTSVYTNLISNCPRMVFDKPWALHPPKCRLISGLTGNLKKWSEERAN